MSVSDSEKIRETPKVKPQEQVKDNQPQKTSQSAFDKVLEQSKALQQSPVNVQAASQKGAEKDVKEVFREQDGKKGRDKDSDDRDSEKGKDSVRDKKGLSQTLTRQAVARTKSDKESGGQSGQQGKKDQGGGGYEGQQRLKTTSLKRTGEATTVQGEVEHANFSTKLKSAEKASHTQAMQKIVNSIVQAFRVGLNVDGEKELQLDLKEKIFKGLRLRLTSKRGKVSIQLLTATASVRDIFEKNAPEIRKMLEQKGIAVADIKVT